MSADVKKIALYLRAAGFTAKDEKASSILKEDDGNLIEQNLDGTDIIDEIFIAEDVEPDTSALYINREDRVACFPPPVMNSGLTRLSSA